MDRELERMVQAARGVIEREEYGEAEALQAQPVTIKLKLLNAEIKALREALINQRPGMAARVCGRMVALLAATAEPLTHLDRLYRHQGELFDPETGEIKPGPS